MIVGVIKMILDVGCGAHLWGDVGVDLGPKVLAVDSGYITKANVYASAEYLPFRDDSFEVVHFVGLLHHLHRPEKAWAEMVRVSRDLIVGEEPSKFNLWAYRDPYHVFKGFRKRELWKILRSVKCGHVRLGFYISEVFKLRVNYQIIAMKRISQETWVGTVGSITERLAGDGRLAETLSRRRAIIRSETGN